MYECGKCCFYSEDFGMHCMARDKKAPMLLAYCSEYLRWESIPNKNKIDYLRFQIDKLVREMAIAGCDRDDIQQAFQLIESLEWLVEREEGVAE